MLAGLVHEHGAAAVVHAMIAGGSKKRPTHTMIHKVSEALGVEHENTKTPKKQTTNLLNMPMPREPTTKVSTPSS